jgi:hypothetical protein
MVINHTTQQALDAQVIVGIQKDLPNASNLPLAGSTYTQATLEQLVQSRIDAANAVATARANWHDAVAKYKALSPEVTKVVRALRQYVLNVYGANGPILSDFGFTAPKRAVLTPEQLTARAKKAAATREARGTMSKKAKSKIKGTVPPTVPSTSPTPSTPAVPAPSGATPPRST